MGKKWMQERHDKIKEIFSNNEFQCFTVDFIADEVGVSRYTVIKDIRLLRANGFDISKKQTSKGQGLGSTCVYRLKPFEEKEEIVDLVIKEKTESTSKLLNSVFS